MKYTDPRYDWDCNYYHCACDMTPQEVEDKVFECRDDDDECIAEQEKAKAEGAWDIKKHEGFWWVYYDVYMDTPDDPCYCGMVVLAP